MNQSKISGNVFCDLYIDGYVEKNKPVYKLSEFVGYIEDDIIGMKYRLNRETIDELGIKNDFYEDFLEQLVDMGSIHDIRKKMGMEFMSGNKEVGLTLRHREMPKIMVHLRVQSASNKTIGFNPNVGNYPVDILATCYIDVSHVEPEEYRDDEEMMNQFNALSFGGMKHEE